MKIWTFLTCLALTLIFSIGLSAQDSGECPGSEGEPGKVEDWGDSKIPDKEDATEEEVEIEIGGGGEEMLESIKSSLKGAPDYVAKLEATDADFENFIKLAPILGSTGGDNDEENLVASFKALKEKELVKNALKEEGIDDEGFKRVFRVFVLLMRSKGVEGMKEAKKGMAELAEMLKEMGMDEESIKGELDYCDKAAEEYEKLPEGTDAERKLIADMSEKLDTAFEEIMPQSECEDCEEWEEIEEE